jgi:hypothetical protein
MPEPAYDQAEADNAIADDHDRGVGGVPRQFRPGGFSGDHHGYDQ